MNKLQTFTKGIIRENPVLRLVLGTCPALAVSTEAVNGIGMGIAATVVLVLSNTIISLLRNVIPDKVRIPAYITIIAGLVTVVQIVIKAMAPSIDTALGIYLPLIVVNCIILGRAEAYAAKNPVVYSILDGLGMGIGFTLALLCMGIIRELLGAGTLFGITITANVIAPMTIMVMAPGGFFVFGILIALINKLEKKLGPVDRSSGSACAGCPSADMCGANEQAPEKEVEA